MLPPDECHQEARALRIGTFGNAIGAFSALLFYLSSGSDALMLDGLYTAVMAGASLLAGRVNSATQQPRSRSYPFGASGQEPLYVLFRTLVLLGILAFAVVSAGGKVVSHLQGVVAPAVRLDGLGWYFGAMVLMNVWLWTVFTSAWSSSGRNSAMLRGMAISARFDALISAVTGMALLGSPLLQGTILAPVAPIADALLVLALSMAFLPEPLAVLKKAIAEAAGSGQSVPAASQSQCRQALVAVLEPQGCILIELAMIRLGRTVTAVAYVDPNGLVTAHQLDDLRAGVEQVLRERLQSPVLCEVIATALHPYTEAGH